MSALSHPHELGGRSQEAVAAPQLKDPVCGMTVRPESPHRLDYKGTTYYFCSASCRAKFEADPERYLAAGAAPTTRPQAAASPQRPA
jgi:Cu+-exporting ATPase